MRLRELSIEAYAAEVLPHTAPLWSGRRDFATYVEQTRELASSVYGRRHYRTVGLYDGDILVASFKRYEREVHVDDSRFRVVGFGAVFTPAEFRGRGYASYMIAAELDRAREAGFGAAYLFSDIAPQFYVQLGFRELPSRMLTLRADALPAQRVRPSALGADDWAGVRRCFDRAAERRTAGFLRSSAMQGWIETRMQRGAEHTVGHGHNLVVRKGRSVRAYVLGVRVPERDAYVVDEFGFSDAPAAETIPALLRAAAGDLRRVVGWLPPEDARPALPSGSTRKRTSSILMMAALQPEGERLIERVSTLKRSDFCWPTDHI